MERLGIQRVDVVDDAVGREAAEGVDLVAVDAEQHADRVRLGDRDAQHHLPGGAGGGILRGVELGVVELAPRSEEHTSELQSLMRISYDVFCLKKKTTQTPDTKRK